MNDEKNKPNDSTVDETPLSSTPEEPHTETRQDLVIPRTEELLDVEMVMFSAIYPGAKGIASKPKEGLYLARRILLSLSCFIQGPNSIDVRVGSIPAADDVLVLSGGFFALPSNLQVVAMPNTQLLVMAPKVDFDYVRVRPGSWIIQRLDFTEATTFVAQRDLELSEEREKVARMSEQLSSVFCAKGFDAGLLKDTTEIHVNLSMNINGHEHQEFVVLPSKGKSGFESAMFVADHYRYIAGELGAKDYYVEILVEGITALKYEGRPQKADKPVRKETSSD